MTREEEEERAGKKRSVLDEVKEFVNFLKSMWGILAGITAVFPLSNALLNALPLPSGQESLSTTLATLFSIFCIFVLFTSRFAFARWLWPRSIVFSIVIFISATSFLCVYLWEIWKGIRAFYDPLLYGATFGFYTVSFTLLALKEFTRETRKQILEEKDRIQLDSDRRELLLQIDSLKEELRHYEPLDHRKPLEKDRLEYKDVPNAIELLVEKIRSKDPDIVLAVDRGGSIVGGMLAKSLQVPIRLLYRTNSEFHSDFDTSDVNGKVVVLVDDASRTGRSLEKAKTYFEKHFSPKSLIVAVILLTEVVYGIHKDTTPSKLVDCFAYFTDKADIRMPWDRRE